MKENLAYAHCNPVSWGPDPKPPVREPGQPTEEPEEEEEPDYDDYEEEESD